jgi:phosphoesterase RecJ-like protein
MARAARIVDSGLDVAAFTDKTENNWNLERMHLWGRLMSEISLHAGGAIVMSVVPRRYLDEMNLGKDDLEGYASWLRRLEGARVALLVREDAPGRCKISLRSMGDFDVRAVAELYGGGGHASAAGAELELAPEDVAQTVLAELKARLWEGR